MDEIAINELTDTSLTGDGTFDRLMRATKAHLDAEFKMGRIKGGEYAQVYLGSLTAVMQTALQFTLEQRKAAQDAALTQAKIQTERYQQGILKQQQINLATEHETAKLQQAQLRQQTENLRLEADKLKAETAQMEQQTENLAATKAQTLEQTALVKQQTLNAITQ
ncbi:hypothetical protein QC825_14360, partial [Larsenimonas suaedae]